MEENKILYLGKTTLTINYLMIVNYSPKSIAYKLVQNIVKNSLFQFGYFICGYFNLLSMQITRNVIRD